MAVNWGLGVRQQSPIDAFRAAFEQGQERKRETEARNALSAYAQNPNEQGLNALAQFAPEFAIQERGRLAQQQQAGVEQQRAEVTRRLEMISRVAAVADTPEKWDAGVDYLAQFYPDLAEYKGKFTPQAREAAIAAAGNVDKYLERMQPVNLGPGSRLVDPNSGKVIAEAPFAPRAVTLNPGQMAVEYAPGGTGMDTETIFGRMIHTESRGRQFGANGQPLTSPAGAIGIAQVMPGTAPEAAQLAGLPFDENRYRTDPEYNAALGKAYFEKQLADFGDPEMAVAAYNAGPGRVQAAVRRGGENWKQYLPAETKGYLQSVFGGGTGRVIGRGEPKQNDRWRTLSPQEVQQRGLPAGTYQESPTGEIKPLGGQNNNSRKGEADLRREFNNLPEVKTFREVHRAMSQIASIGKKAANATAQDDMAMIFSYMKMLDPGSVVREGEFATAQNAAGVPDQMRNLYNRTLEGNRLNPTQRRNMVRSAKTVYEPVLNRYNDIAVQYQGYARDYGVEPSRVARRFVYGSKQQAPQRGQQQSNGWGKAKVVQ